MIHRFALVLSAALLVCMFSGCGTVAAQTASSTSTPTITHLPTATPAPMPPTPTNVPAGWQVYSGTHFTIAYPAGWTYTTSPHQQDREGGGVRFSSPDYSGIISVGETYGFGPSDLQSWCHFSGTYKMLAGIQMQYTLGEGTIRYWSFANSQSVVYDLNAFDATWSQDVQALDDSVLATFRPDDTTPLCSH